MDKKILGILGLKLILVWGFSLSGVQAQSFFTFTYTGPDTLYVDASCEAVLDWGYPQTPTVDYDAPPGGVLLSFDIWSISGGYEIGDTLPVGETVTVTYEALDNQGNFEFFSFELSSTDSIAPEVDWSPIPDTLNVFCSDDLLWTIPPATDNCTAENELIGEAWLTDSISTCTGGQTTRVFQISDAFSNSRSFEQTVIMVWDTLAPEIIESPRDTTLYCESAEIDIPLWLDQELSRFQAIDDPCDSIHYAIDSTTLLGLDSLCGEAPIRFFATDGCGNQSAVEASLFLIDSVVPSLISPARDTLFSCAGQDGLAVLESWLNDLGGMEVEENCELFTSYAPAEINFTDICNQSIDVTFTAADRCGAAVSSTAKFELIDTLAPEFVDPPNNLISTCAGEHYLQRAEDWLIGSGGAQVEDLCAPDSLIENLFRVNGMELSLAEVLDSIEQQALQGCRDSVAVGGNRLDDVLVAIQLELIFRDPCGNTLISEPRWLALIDSESPIILSPADDTTILCSDSIQVRDALLQWYDNRAGLQVMDDCGSIINMPSIDRDSVWKVYLAENSGSCGFTGQLELQFLISDLCGRTAPTQDASFSVIDTVAPTLVNPPLNLELNCSDGGRDSLRVWMEAGAFATFSENCGGAELDSFFWTDSEGRSGFGILGEGPYPDISNVGCSYSVSVDFQLRDPCGNELLFSAFFSLVDTIAPSFSAYPDSLILSCGEPALLFIDSLIEHCFPALLTVDVVDDTLRSGTPADCSYYTFIISRTITATDFCGNSSSFQQHIEYIDESVPMFTPPADTVITCAMWESGVSLSMPSAISDDCGGPVDISFTDSIVDQTCGFSVIREWIMEDVCGNRATHIQNIEVQDEQPPVFEVQPSSGTVLCMGALENAEPLFGDFIDSINVEFSDNCSSVSHFIALPGSYDQNIPGSWPGDLPSDFSWSCGVYEVDTLFHVELDFVIFDGCNQVSISPFSFTVIDSISPELICPSDTILYVGENSCDINFELSSPQLDWGCSDEARQLLVSLDSTQTFETFSPDTLAFSLSSGISTFEFFARSCSGNEASCIQRVEVIDTIAPEIICPSDSVIFLPADSCELAIELPTPIFAEDNCPFLDSVIIEYSDDRGFFNSNWVLGDSIGPTADLIGGENIISFEVSDASGNTDLCKFSYELIDTTAPIANCRPALVRVNPSGLIETEIDPALFDVNSSDVCGIDSMATIPAIIDCSWVGQDTSILLIVFDAYGNSDSCETFMRVETEVLQPQFELNICSPDTLRLIATPPPPANIYTYSWTGPNNFSSNLQNPILTDVDGSNAGTYTLEIEGIGGCTAEGAVTVNIGQDIIPDLTVNFPTQCEGQTIRLLSNAYAGSVDYHWYEGLPPNGVLMGSSTQPIFELAPTVGVHDYYVVVETAECESVPSLPVQVEIILQPSAEVEEELILVCEGEEALLRGVNEGPGFLYSWVGPNGYFSDVAMPPALEDLRVSDAGIYQFITEIGDCVSDPALVELIVRERPTTAQFEPQDTICEGSSFELSLVSPLTGDQYRWLLPNQSEITTQVPRLPIDQAQLFMSGIWEAEVIRDGCSSDSVGEILIEIESIPTLNIEQSGSQCEGDTAILSVPNFPRASYMWSTPLGSYPGAEIRVPAQAGTYQVTYLSSNDCQTGTSIDLDPIQSPTITAISNSSTVCLEAGTDIELRASVFPLDTGAYTYRWTGPNGFVDNAAVGTISNVSSSSVGWYSLSVSQSGCSSEPDSTRVDFTIIPDAPEISGPLTYCAGDTLELKVNGVPGSDVSYLWLTPKGDTLTRDSSLNLLLSDNSYLGYYQVRSAVGECRGAFSDSVFVRVISLPDIPSIEGETEICEGEDLRLQPSSLDPNLEYRWTFSNGEVSSQSVFLEGSAGQRWTGSVQIEAFREGCSSGISSPAQILVKERPAAPIIDHPATGVCLLDETYDIEVCISDSMAMGGVNYQWFNAEDFSPLSELSGNLCFTLTEEYDWVPGQNSFTVRSELASCLSDFSVPINIEATQPSDFDPMAGEGDTICGSETFITQGLSPLSGSAEWAVVSGSAVFDDPSNPQTEVSDFDFGLNILSWTLSEGFCQNYVQDSITVWYDDFPFAESDSFSTPFNERRRLPVLVNDDFLELAPLEVAQAPQFGELQNLNDEFLYFPQNGFIGTDMFTYRICSDLCPDLCSIAEVLVQVGDESLCDIPTIFTPNDDGINDIFVIQCLSSEDYPNNKLVIFNQNGSEVYYGEPYQNDWIGKYNGKDLPVGTYFYILDFGDGQPPQRGFLILER